MGTKINWVGDQVKLYFNDIGLNEGFRIKSPASRGAVYQKVRLSLDAARSIDPSWSGDADEDLFFAKEVETGIISKPTRSEVEPVDLNITVAAPKPNIYQ